MTGDLVIKREPVSYDTEDTELAPADRRRAEDTARRTVAAFSGLLGRALAFRDGEGPATDGSVISVPLGRPDHYTDLERLLAHLWFRSDPVALRVFAERWTKGVAAKCAEHGAVPDLAAVRATITAIAGVLEQRRVLSLFREIYPGSGERIAAQERARAQTRAPDPDRGVLARMIRVSAGEENGGALAGIEPILRAALTRVERKAFVSTLTETKRVVSELVSLIARAKAADDMAILPDGRQGNPGRDGWNPSAAEKAAAMEVFAEEMCPPAPGGTWDFASEIRDPAVSDSEAERCARNIADRAIHADPTSTSFADAAAGEGAAELKGAREAFGSGFAALHNPGASAGARVVFVDPAPAPVLATPTVEDRLAANRLRAVFQRIEGQRRTALEDTGTELDTGAWAERKASRRAIPCFKADVRGRGLRVIVLVDRSKSMLEEDGKKLRAAKRAARIMENALRGLPGVTLDLWGFTSLANGQVDITRYPSGGVEADGSRAGLTPTFAAIRVAAEELARGRHVREMLVVTDGVPVAARRDGVPYSPSAAVSLTREAVASARKKGIGVTGVMIGDDVEDERLEFMYGSHRDWRRVSADGLADGLVSLVSTAIVRYLKGR